MFRNHLICSIVKILRQTLHSFLFHIQGKVKELSNKILYSSGGSRRGSD